MVKQDKEFEERGLNPMNFNKLSRYKCDNSNNSFRYYTFHKQSIHTIIVIERIMIIRHAQLSDTPAIAKVHVDSWRSTYYGIVSNEYLSSLSYEKREKIWMNTLVTLPTENSLLVAESPEGKVVGFSYSGPERESDKIYKGEIYGLYLLKPYQRQGIGSQLFRSSVKELLQKKFPSMLIWALVANPACKFYEAMGGKRLREKKVEIGQQKLMEVAFGWMDIRNMVNEVY
jgi:ribosomal protein S18 acetylase RimI-like enzyme